MREHFSQLLQLRVLGLGLLQDGDLRIGVFPKVEKIVVGGERPDAGGLGIAALRGSRLQSIRPCHTQMRQGSRPAVPDKPIVVENLLELHGGSRALSRSEIRLAANERGIETGQIADKKRNLPKFNRRRRRFQILESFCGNLPIQRHLGPHGRDPQRLRLSI
jgi:hypothetical protein